MDTQGGPAPVPKDLARDDVKMSTQSSLPPSPTEKVQDDQVKDFDDSADQSSANTQINQWRLAKDLQYFDINNQAGSRKLGVTWKNLSVNVVPADERFQENILSQFNLLQLVKDLRAKPALKTILESSSGCVRPGEMLLVLGRPGSGCTTLLKMLANKRNGYVPHC
jgi:ATP-binding cassette subfamily G (WHITE) protein 2 (SNQ2)